MVTTVRAHWRSCCRSARLCRILRKRVGAWLCAVHFSRMLTVAYKETGRGPALPSTLFVPFAVHSLGYNNIGTDGAYALAVVFPQCMALQVL